MKIGIIKPLLALALCAATAETWGQDVIIQARASDTVGDGQWLRVSGNWQPSSVKSTAPGTDQTVPGSLFATRPVPEDQPIAFSLVPNLQAGGTYLFEVALPAPASQSDQIVTSIDVVGGTLSDFGPGTTLNGGVVESTVFQQAGGSSSWRLVGTLTLEQDVSNPVITVTHIGGALPAGDDRFYADAFRFVDASDPCLSGLATLATVNGPLAAGQTVVNVPGVNPAATAVTVYADGVQIGQKTTGIVGGDTVEVVTTSALVAGQVISVTQSNGAGVESCRPNTGPIVGGGANPPVRVAFSLRLDPTLAGPIGAQGTSGSTWLWMLGATGPSAGFGTAPLGGASLSPNTCWQEVNFHFDFNGGYTWAGAPGDPGLFAILDSIAFSMEPPFDTGPYAIYIDNIRNGPTVIEDFEGVETNIMYLFPLPNFSGSTSGNLLSGPPGTPSPNISVVSNENADTGTNSVFVNWQFKDAAEGSWLRLPLQGAGNPNPQVDLSLPISVRLLILPVGESSGALQVATLGDRTAAIGDNVTLEATVLEGTGTYTYEWRFEGNPIPDQTGSTLTLNNAQAEASGNYSVVVSDSTCSTEASGTLTVSDVVPEPELTYTRNGDDSLTLSWTDTQAVLQSAATLTGSDSDWSDVTGATNPHTVDTSTGDQFFRLIRR